MKRCPCCGYLTIDDTDELITDICDVCFWQYDEVAEFEAPCAFQNYEYYTQLKNKKLNISESIDKQLSITSHSF